MRVIAGEFRSRRLKSLPGLATRPTPDRLREALFNVLTPRIQDATFIDAYAGTGAVGIEALSRGAQSCVFIEKNPAAVEILRDNLAALGVKVRSEVYTGKATTVLERLSADLIFLDPPYDADREYEVCLELLGATTTGLVLVQHDSHRILLERYGQLSRTRILKHGSNSISFYSSENRDLDQS